jgi:hypothetical protein
MERIEKMERMESTGNPLLTFFRTCTISMTVLPLSQCTSSLFYNIYLS